MVTRVRSNHGNRDRRQRKVGPGPRKACASYDDTCCTRDEVPLVNCWVTFSCRTLRLMLFKIIASNTGAYTCDSTLEVEEKNEKKTEATHTSRQRG